MIKDALGYFATYLMPAALVTGSFSMGHMYVQGESDRLTAYRIEHGLIPDPAEAAIVEDLPKEIQLDANGKPIEASFLAPTYRYFEIPVPFTGNFDDSKRLYKLQLALSIHQSVLESDSTIAKLQEFEPQIRPVIVTALIGVSEEMLRSREGRQALLAQIHTAVNDQLIKLELKPVVEDVVITDLVLT
jgi:flagellar basal body-associated protein FliL